jgi:hypothetical protein
VGRKIVGFLSFVLALALLVGALKVMNWLPSVVQEGFVSEYKDIEDVRDKLKIKDIYVPSYFPQPVKWPPSAIWAQTRPFTAIVMEFKNVENGDIELTISQVSAKARFIPDNKIKIEQVREKVDYSLKGRKALLEVGACENEERCSLISWIEGKYRITVAMKSPPFELIKIAESMLK